MGEPTCEPFLPPPAIDHGPPLGQRQRIRFPTPPPMPRFVVTGPAHSGTGWLAAALTAAGIPTGHENWFSLHADYSPDFTLHGDVAWTAVPYLADLRAKGIPVGRIVRDPWLTAASIHGEGWLDDPDATPAGRFVQAYASEILGVEPGPNRAAAYVTNWLFKTNTLPTFRLDEVSTSGSAFMRMAWKLGIGRGYLDVDAALAVPAQGHKERTPGRGPFAPTGPWPITLDVMRDDYLNMKPTQGDPTP